MRCRVFRWHRLVPVVALLLAACIQVGGGDGSRALRRHALDTVTPPPAAEPLPAIAVRPFEGRLRYDLRVVERTESGALSFLEFERWAEPPGDAITDAVREALVDGDVFASVSRSGAGHETLLVLDGYLRAFDLVVSAGGRARARLRLRLAVSHASDGIVLHSGVFQAERELPAAGAEGLGPAMTACVGDVMAQAVAEWRSALGAR